MKYLGLSLVVGLSLAASAKARTVSAVSYGFGTIAEKACYDAVVTCSTAFKTKVSTCVGRSIFNLSFVGNAEPDI